MMAQRSSRQAYDAILAGAPAIHWDRFQAYQIWPQLDDEAGSGRADVGGQAQHWSPRRAVAWPATREDGVTDGVIDDPRTCSYDPTNDVESHPCRAVRTTAA